tara:strand:- start:257 stop:1714 length:1458 start_codon:yes stop_codon:yes gene_type:complete
MTLQISHTSNIDQKSSRNYALFANEKFQVENLRHIFSSPDQISYFNEIIKKKNNKKNFLLFDLNSKETIILIKLKNNLDSSYIESLGAEFFSFIKNNSVNELIIHESTIKKSKMLEEFLHGVNLKSYEFNLYKSNNKEKVIKINVLRLKKNLKSESEIRFKSLLEGTNFARDLVSEPPNILNPNEYVKRLLKLKDIGIKVSVYDEKKLKNLGMFSLLGVGQGSINESFLVTLEWNGKKSNNKELISFVGKGVCFDTGGISLKPAKFMEEMKYDMAGSAVVAGLMKNLAMRKAKVNAVGVLGLVENMPGGNAQRPGDIVKSYSGKTIEVLNTDAEGRLVLADALSFTEKKFKPKLMIDLATLTGAIIMALGEEYAGLFSNDDKLSEKIIQAGKKVNEKVWRMPLHKNYDKLIDSTIADVQNINYAGGAGSITAAQFLQRFIINKTPWAHLDIAGMAFSKKAANLNPGGATGFGVRLLNKFIEDNYE